MSFNVQLLKTKVTDFLHTLETDLGPWFKHLENGFHSVVDQVHDQVEQDAKAAETVAAGAVQTVEGQVEEDVNTAANASDAPTGDTSTADTGTGKAGTGK